jgi:hypothetical protein
MGLAVVDQLKYWPRADFIHTYAAGPGPRGIQPLFDAEDMRQRRVVGEVSRLCDRRIQCWVCESPA